MCELEKKDPITLEKILIVLVCAVLIDCSIFGSFNILPNSPLSIRSLLVLLAFSCAVIILIKNRETYGLCRTLPFFLLLFFFAWLIISAFRGYFLGHSLSLISHDLKGFFFFIFLLPVLCCLRDYSSIELLMKVVMYSALVLAVATILHLMLYILKIEVASLVLDWEWTHGLVNYTSISSSIPRLLYQSDLYLLSACVFSIYFQYISRQFRLRYALIIGLCGFSLMITFTRAIYLSVVIVLIGLFLFVPLRCRHAFFKKFLVTLIVGILVIITINGVFLVLSKTNYFSFALSRTFTSVEISSDANSHSELENSPSSNLYSDSNLANSQEASLGDESAISTEEGSSNDTESNAVTEIKPPSSENGYNLSTIESDKKRAMLKDELYEAISSSPVIGKGLGYTVSLYPSGGVEYSYLDFCAKLGILGIVLLFAPLLWMLIGLIHAKNEQNRFMLYSWFLTLCGMLVYCYFHPYLYGSLLTIYYATVVGIFLWNSYRYKNSDYVV